MNVLDLFSGIGGFKIASHFVGGFKTIAFCEIDPFCQSILKRNFPEIPIFDDVRSLNDATFRTLPRIDVVCGGFPCQDISQAGRRAGIAGTRSGLFFEIIRVVRLVRPRFIVLENVRALLWNGMDIVLRELSENGYDAEWATIPCSDLGGVHKRERVWIVAYPASASRHDARTDSEANCSEKAKRAIKTVRSKDWGFSSVGPKNCIADRWTVPQSVVCRSDDGISDRLVARSELMALDALSDWLPLSTDRFSNSILPHRGEMLKALGNSVVPQVASIALQRVKDLEAMRCATA